MFSEDYDDTYDHEEAAPRMAPLPYGVTYPKLDPSTLVIPSPQPSKPFPWLAAAVGALALGAVIRSTDKVKKMPAKGEKDTEREVMFLTAMKHLEEPSKLRALAEQFALQGLTSPRYGGHDDWAEMLRRRATYIELPQDVKKARRDAFRKGMSSLNKAGVLTLAGMFRDQGAWIAADKLEEHAKGLPDTPLDMSKVAAPATVAGEYGAERGDLGSGQRLSGHDVTDIDADLRGGRYGSMLGTERSDQVSTTPFFAGQTTIPAEASFGGTSAYSKGAIPRHGRHRHHGQGGQGGQSQQDDGAIQSLEAEVQSLASQVAQQTASNPDMTAQGEGSFGAPRPPPPPPPHPGGYSVTVGPGGKGFVTSGSPSAPLAPHVTPRPAPPSASRPAPPTGSSSAYRPAPPTGSSSGYRPAPPTGSSVQRPPPPPPKSPLSYQGFGNFSQLGQGRRRFADDMFPDLSSGGSSGGMPSYSPHSYAPQADSADGTLSATSPLASPQSLPSSSTGPDLSSAVSTALGLAQSAQTTAAQALGLASGGGGGGGGDPSQGGGDPAATDSSSSSGQSQVSDEGDSGADMGVDFVTGKRVGKKAGDYAIGGKPGVRQGMMRG